MLPKNQIVYNLTLILCEGKLRILTEKEAQLLSEALSEFKDYTLSEDKALEIELDDEDLDSQLEE